MRYSLVLVDLDDTLAPNLGMPPRPFTPSTRLREAVHQAQKVASISLCTGRDKETVLKIVETLTLTASQVIEGGAKIINTKGDEMWTKYISSSSVHYILELLKTTKTSFSIIVDGAELMDVVPNENLEKISAVLWYDLTDSHVESLKSDLSARTDLAIARNSDRSGNTIYVTHREGTKAHGVKRLTSMVGVAKEQVIGIGDGLNDLPLLTNCGFKVAMDNAAAEVKVIADYVAPSVDSDGVAHVIEKFILGR